VSPEAIRVHKADSCVAAVLVGSLRHPAGAASLVALATPAVPDDLREAT
jgi:hypothetical protein